MAASTRRINTVASHMPEHLLMSDYEIITDEGRRRRWSPAEKLRIVEGEARPNLEDGASMSVAVRRMEDRIRELERQLGRKTLDVEIRKGPQGPWPQCGHESPKDMDKTRSERALSGCHGRAIGPGGHGDGPRTMAGGHGSRVLRTSRRTVSGEGRGRDLGRLPIQPPGLTGSAKPRRRSHKAQDGEGREP